MTPFYVINHDGNKFDKYDVMPYLIDCYNKSENKPKTFEEFKEFVTNKSRYRYWARCQYEILLAEWPFGSYKMIQEMKEFLNKPVNLDDYKERIDFENIIMREMKKIDVFWQIMNNIDVVTTLLIANINDTDITKGRMDFKS